MGGYVIGDHSTGLVTLEMGKATLLALLAEAREGPGGAGGSNSGVSVLELNCHVSILDFPIVGVTKKSWKASGEIVRHSR